MPPASENWDKPVEHVWWRHFEGMLAIYSSWHTENTQETFIEALLCANKLIHPLSVSLTSLNNMHTLRHTWWLRGLRAFRAHLDLGLQWIITMMWCMLSILICQRGLGIVLTDGWDGPDRAAQARSVCPPSSSGTSALLSPSPERKRWQVRCTTSSRHTAGRKDTAEVNEVIANSGANRHSAATVRAEVWFGDGVFLISFITAYFMHLLQNLQ